VNTTTSVLLTMAIVIGGRWAQGETIHPRIVVGVLGSAVFLSLIGEFYDAGLAKMFGVMILLTAVFAYLPDITKKLGLTS
jgi:hypothetical protein